MGKKIVVITGSPRKDGNSFAMTDAFITAAQTEGHSVTRFDAAMKKSAAAMRAKPASRLARRAVLTMTSTKSPLQLRRRTQ